jgi:hypothetical protein
MICCKRERCEQGKKEKKNVNGSTKPGHGKKETLIDPRCNFLWPTLIPG